MKNYVMSDRLYQAFHPFFEEKWLLRVIAIIHFRSATFKEKEIHTHAHTSSFSCQRMSY